MTALLPFIIIGIATGSVYGLNATGLVLTYRTSGIFNFAQGAIAAAAAYVFYWLYVVNKMPWVPAFILSVFIFGPIMGLLMERIARRLTLQSTALKIVGTVGVILVVQGLAEAKFGTDALLVPEYFPSGSKTVTMFGANITYAQIIITVLAVVAVVALYALFRFTRVGVKMRAVVDDHDLVSLQGSSPERIRMVAWTIGTTFAAMSGVLLAPLAGLEAISLTFLVVNAFGAVAIGRFTSIPWTFVGGLVIGIGASLLTKYSVTLTWMNGLPEGLPFIVLFVALLFTPRRRFGSDSAAVRPRPLEWHGPPAGRLMMGVVLLAVLAVVPQVVGVRLPYYTVGLALAILLLSLGLLARTAGIVSLCTAAFAAIGAVAFSHFEHLWGLPWLLTLIIAALVVVPVAAILALPAARLPTLFLALSTFGFGLTIQYIFYDTNFMFTPLGQGLPMGRPSFARGDTAFYYVVLLGLVLVALLSMAIHRGRLGRLLRSVSESPTAAQTLGLDTAVTRLIAFCIAGFLAGIGGILYGCTLQAINSTDAHYTSFYSLVIIAILFLAPMRDPWYAIFGVIAAVIPAYWTSLSSTQWLNAIFGAFAILTAVLGGTAPAPMAFRELVHKIFDRVTLPSFTRRTAFASADADERPHDGARKGLEVEDLVVRFGGHVALQGVALKAPAGRITGLIGPNGAGKTTLFNACSGLLRPADGKVVFGDHDVTRLGPAARGERGLGRTFQIMQLSNAMTVFDNVLLGCEAGQAGAKPLRQVFSTPHESRKAEARAREAVAMCGLNEVMGEQVGGLSTGQRRLVELARCLAGEFDLLLLDEPSSGLDPAETDRFAGILQEVVRQRGIGVLLVEHDVDLVARICEHIFVLDFGRMLMDGTPSEVTSSPAVRTAYLGSSENMDVRKLGEATL